MTTPDSDRDDVKDKRGFIEEVAYRFSKRQEAVNGVRPHRGRTVQKRDMSNGSMIDPWYGCDVWHEMIDYALNNTFPWCKHHTPAELCALLIAIHQRNSVISMCVGSRFLTPRHLISMQTFDVPDALNPEAPDDPTFFFNGEGRSSMGSFIAGVKLCPIRSQGSKRSACPDKCTMERIH